MTYDILIVPQQLLRIRFLDVARNERDMVALTCAYVPAQGADGALRVAVEIVIDPAMQNPAVPYYSDPQGLQRYVIPPAHLRGINPYWSA